MPESAMVRYDILELEGVRYAVLREALFAQLLRKAGVAGGEPPSAADPLDALGDPRRIAGRLLERRQRLGLSQAELARRSGLRPETLNRLERGASTPDFSTIRQLVQALRDCELQQAAARLPAGRRPRRTSNDGFAIRRKR